MEVREVESDENIVCPFCNEIVIEADDIDSYSPCAHTILVATDEGIEEADEDLIDTEALEEKIDEEELGYDEAISALDIPNAVLIKQYQPGGFGAYHLFKAE